MQVAVSYTGADGKAVEDFPSHLADLERCRPVFETMPGWSEEITGARTWDDLPRAARNYVDFLETQIGVPISIVSVGPDRTQTISRPRA